MAKKLKIAIDISPLSTGHSQRGIGYFTKNLVSAIQSETRTNSDFQNFEICLIENCKLKIENFDLVHYPYFDPFFLTLPRVSNIPRIVSVYDLIPIQFKDHFPVGIRGWIKWQIQKYRLNQSNYLTTSSHTSKYIIHRYTSYPLDKIYVIPGAADKSFKPIDNSSLLSSVQSRYHLPKKFVLYVGDLNWSKNIPNLVKACFKLNYPLVIVGSAATKKFVENHPWNQDLIWLQKQTNSLLHLTGFVPDKDLPLIFNLATVYCQPSFAEGFGLPLIQAIQSGTPVAYSIDSCLNEIMDYRGEYFNPHSLSQIKISLSKLWNNAELRQKYRLEGLQRARVFSWRNSALQTLALYRLALLHGQ
jgi:glycosyltransferase involved in cell wall biosynthesis